MKDTKWITVKGKHIEVTKSDGKRGAKPSKLDKLNNRTSKKNLSSKKG